jgi:hypothetical protein
MMTKEDKQLLLQDLSARLSYGVVYHRNDGANIKLNEIDVDHCRLNYTDDIEERECKPYLRPMESMTEEEAEEYRNIDNRAYSCPMDYAHIPASERIDWLNANHFDYRGLIPKGLALEVPKDMYK